MNNPPISTPDFSIGGFLKFVANNTKRHFLKFIVLALVGLAFSAAFAGIYFASAFVLEALALPAAVTFALGIIVMVLSGILSTAAWWFILIKNLLNLCRGQKMIFIKVNPRTFINFTAASALLIIIVTAGSMAFTVPGIILGVMFMFVPYLIADRNMRAIDAFRESARLSKGHWKNMLLGLFISILVIGIPACLVSVAVYVILLITGYSGAGSLTGLIIMLAIITIYLFFMIFVNLLVMLTILYPYLCLTSEFDEMRDKAVEAEMAAEAV